MIGESSYTRAPVLQRQLRDFAVVGGFALLIATVAFVAVRNTELAARQTAVAERAALELSEGKAPLPTVHGALVTPATPSKKHPYLRHRQIREPDGAWRHLGGMSTDQTHGDDKLFYDAATRFEQLHQSELTEMMRDGSG